VVQLIAYYLGYTLPPALIAFSVVWWKQRASLPASLGALKLIALFIAVWSISITVFAVLHITTALVGYENLSAFEGPYSIVAGLVGFKAGMSAIERMLRKARAETV